MTKQNFEVEVEFDVAVWAETAHGISNIQHPLTNQIFEVEVEFDVAARAETANWCSGLYRRKLLCKPTN